MAEAFLVTAPVELRMNMWATVATFTNWIEGRGPAANESWLVMCPGEYTESFLNVARSTGVTVERVEGVGDDERYVMLIGEPGTGWQEGAGK